MNFSMFTKVLVCRETRRVWGQQTVLRTLKSANFWVNRKTFIPSAIDFVLRPWSVCFFAWDKQLKSSESQSVLFRELTNPSLQIFVWGVCGNKIERKVSRSGLCRSVCRRVWCLLLPFIWKWSVFEYFIFQFTFGSKMLTKINILLNILGHWSNYNLNSRIYAFHNLSTQLYFNCAKYRVDRK